MVSWNSDICEFMDVSALLVYPSIATFSECVIKSSKQDWLLVRQQFEQTSTLLLLQTFKCFVFLSYIMWYSLAINGNHVLLLLRYPAISMGSTLLGEIFAYVTVFNQSMEVVTFCLRGWLMLGVFLLLAFTRLGHESQNLWSPCDGMHVCTD